MTDDFVFVCSFVFSADTTCVCSPKKKQESKNGGMEEDEKQAENGKKVEDRGREPEGEREADKTDSDTGRSRSMRLSDSSGGGCK